MSRASSEETRAVRASWVCAATPLAVSFANVAVQRSAPAVAGHPVYALVLLLLLLAGVACGVYALTRMSRYGVRRLLPGALIGLALTTVMVAVAARAYRDYIDRAAQQAAMPAEIEFELEPTDEERLDFPEGLPWISLQDTERDIARLRDPDTIVLPVPVAIAVIDYPLSRPVEIELAAPSPAGFSRRDLATALSREYHRIYREEEQSAKTKTVPLDQRKGLINRNRTDGTYGIWGHDLADLDLSSIVVHRKDGRVYLELYIES